MRYIPLLLLLLLVGCDNNPARDIPARTDASATAAALAPTPEQEKAKDLQKRLAEAEAARDKAAAENKIIDRLTAERDVLQIRAQIAEEQAHQLLQNVEAYKRQVSDKDEEIKAQRIEEWQTRLYVAAGVLSLLALVATAIAWAWPLLRRFALWAAAILGALAILVAIAAKLLPTVAWILGWIPYLAAVCLIVVAGFGLAALRHWWLDHHTGQQLITAMEEAKPAIGSAREAFKDMLRRHIDSPIETFISKIKARRGIGVKPTDPPAGTSKPTA